MKQIKFSIIILIFIISLSSCVYYKGMPKEWTNQVSEIENCEVFNGNYALSHDNEGLTNNRDYNDLRYFQNDPIYGYQRVRIGWVTSINISITDAEVTIKFYSNKKFVHESIFNKELFECKENTLILKIKNYYVVENIVSGYFIPTITLYKTKSAEVIVKRKETTVGTCLLVPVVAGHNSWFKLRKI